ncbi:MAG: hypothetical protein J6A38_05100 [Clostridia bacterium]|nr:hypothetical protein [Clostridia bacterium]
MIDFALKKRYLTTEYEKPNWIIESGLSLAELTAKVAEFEKENDLPKALIKAKTFELLIENARIAIDKEDIFQDKFLAGNIMAEQKRAWRKAVEKAYLSEETEETKRAWEQFGAYSAHGDYSHISPNSRLLMEVGFTGLLQRVEKAEKRGGLTQKQKEFYQSCKIVLNAMITATNRLAEGVKEYNYENYVALSNIAKGAPSNLYEAMQLLTLYFYLHENVAGARVRTLGRLDFMLYPYYKKDLESGRYTKEEIKEMLKFFLYKFWSAKVLYDLPFCLAGKDENGGEVTNELSYLIVETYNELHIYSPKIHIRVSEKTPMDFVKLVLACIRQGNSSFVFVNDEIGTETLRRVGVEERDARNFIPIGCYEPAVWGVEIGCTGNGGVTLPKAVELVFTKGKDYATGLPCGVETGEIRSFEDFVDAVKTQIAYMAEKMTHYVTEIEKHYDKIYPDAILSCQYDASVERGVDVYEGGAKYNNSSCYFWGIATLVDALCAVKKLVFDENYLTFDELWEALQADWVGYENYRTLALHLDEKYGNGNATADELAVQFSKFCATLVNNKPNGRGGVYKAALFSVDNNVYAGARLMATPDGRKAGMPISKNLCATPAMDKNGITALIHSVTKMDHANFPTGSVLDIVLHPSAVLGESGLHAFYGILITYFKKGGFAMHGNVFNVDDLRSAQKDPEKYANLQVRVCGWNAYFVNLSKVEQDDFIKQAEHCKLF